MARSDRGADLSDVVDGRHCPTRVALASSAPSARAIEMVFALAAAAALRVPLRPRAAAVSRARDAAALRSPPSAASGRAVICCTLRSSTRASSRGATTIAARALARAESRAPAPETPTDARRLPASAFLASTAAFAAFPAFAALDADGVESPNILTTIFFTVAVALLAVITLGVLYLSAREALDKQEEINGARGGRARGARVGGQQRQGPRGVRPGEEEEEEAHALADGRRGRAQQARATQVGARGGHRRRG
jgi:hypothetical protein